MAAVRDLILNLQERKEGNALTSAANDLEKLSRGVDATGNAMHGMESDAKRLNTEIEKSTLRIKDLHKQFAATGDTSLFGDIRKEETRLRNLTKTLKALTPEFAKAGEELGTTVSNSFVQQLGSSLSGAESTPILGPALIAALAGAVAVAAPVFGALLGGAIAGAVGTIGLAGGVLAATKDPVVQSALSQFVDDAKRDFFSIGASFIEPVRQGLAIIDQELANSHLDKVFAPAAQDVTIIADGLARMVRNVLPGFQRALERSAPFATVAADGLAQFGDALGYAFDQISQNKGALEGLKSLFLLLNGTVIGLANTVVFLGNAYAWLADKAGTLFDALALASDIAGAHGQADTFREMADRLHHLGDATVATIPAIHGLGDATAGANKQMERFAQLLDDAVKAEEDFISKSLAVDDATLAVAQGWLDLNDKLVKGKENWDLNTQAGVDNQKMIESQITALDRQRQAAIAQSDGSVAAINAINQAYDQQLAKLLKVAAAAGDSQANLEALAKKYYLDLIVTVQERIQQNQIVKANAIDRALANLMGFAEGGLVPGPTGSPQLAVVHGGERVLTPSQQATIAKGGDGAAAPMALRIDFGGGTDSAFATAFMKLVRSGDITISAGAVV